MKPRTSILTLSALALTLGGPVLSAPMLSAPILGQPQNRQEGRDPKRAFEALKRRFDKDLNGRVSEAEFGGRARAWKRMDLDGDGWLTLADVEARLKTSKGAGGKRKPAAAGAEASMASSVGPATAEQGQGGLALNSLQGFLNGGSSGPAMVLGDVDASAFIEAIRYDDPGFAMPPKTKLSSEQVADLEAWVKMGAPWPEEAEPEMMEMSDEFSMSDASDEGEPLESLNRDIDIEAGREFWSFRPVERQAPPTHEDDAWSRTDVDLTGLPPTVKEIGAYEADGSEDRDARVVDRLLASGAYAERWGRHWLDVARYAESSGKERNLVYPHAWRYRDWVLDAFRRDMPYNEFLQAQVAGDLLPAADESERAWNQIATGYLAIGSKGHANRDKIRFQLDMVDEQIDALSQGMLGLTMSCARCHDHKFDPVPIEDYYSMAGIFLSTETHFGTLESNRNNQSSDLIELPQGANVPNGPSMGPLLLRLVNRGAEQLAERVDEQMEMKEEGTLSEAQQAALRRRVQQGQLDTLEDLMSRFDERGRALPSNRLAMGVSEAEPRDIAVLERGELDRPGEVVKRGIPQLFQPDGYEGVTEGSGRAGLGEWLASDENPLTARVWANRVWLHMFGAGLVSTPDNFGAGGQAPSHPELLDWLASELISSGWSTQALIRELALSRAYRLDSAGDRANEAIDPDVVFVWRMPERRMESEALRDTMLRLAGKLSPERPVGSPLGAFEGSLRDDPTLAVLMREMPVRSVYLPSPRGHVMGTLEAFDAPDPEFVTGDRDETTVATQALFLMNDGEVLRLADAFADRILAAESGEKGRVQLAFEMAYGRKPSSQESRVVRSFLKDYARSVELANKAQAPKGKGEESEGEERLSPRRKRQQEKRRQRERERDLERAKMYGADPAAIEDPERAAWSAFTQSLFQSAEFRVIG